MARGIIYLITNKENGLKYVGSTLLPMNKEWQQHIQLANRMSSEPLHRAFRQYGIHRFGIQELDECDERELDDKREQWIRHYDSYNGENYNYRVFEEEEDEEEEEVLTFVAGVPDHIIARRVKRVMSKQATQKGRRRLGRKNENKSNETRNTREAIKDEF